MKRFKVQTADGHTLLLYYPTQEKAQESYPDATITEHTDQSHVEYIERMIATADDCKTAERKGSTVYLLRFNTSAGICLAMLSRDISDGMWYDLCQYQFWKSGALVAPITKTLSNPALFDYMAGADKPGYELRQLLQQYATRDPNLSERIYTLFQLAQVRDDNRYVNGFTDKLLRQSEIDLGASRDSMPCLLDEKKIVNYPCSRACPLFGDCVTKWYQVRKRA